MTNRPVILKLSNDDGSDVRIDVADLQGLLETLGDAFSAVAHIAAPPPDAGPTMREAPKSKLRFLLVAPPRRACLELVFLPEFVLNFDLSVLIGQFPEAQRGEAESNLAEIISAGCAILGVLAHLYQIWREQSAGGLATPKWLDALMPVLIKRANEDRAVHAHFQRVRRAAMKLGSHKVVLSYAEEIELALSDAVDRGRSIAVGGNKLTGNPGEWIPNGTIECTSEPVRVMFEGREYQAFCARPKENRRAGALVAVWGSENPVPHRNEQSIVRFNVIEDLDAVRMVEESPDGFATADGAIFVTGSSGFR